MLKKNEPIIYIASLLVFLFSISFIPIYAVEIGNSFDQLTADYVTTSTSIIDVNDLYLTSGNFTAGDKYLILSNAQVNCSATNCRVTMQLEHGTTDFTESVQTLEQDGTAAYHTFTWFTVWTAVAGEGIQMELTSPTAGTKTVRQGLISAINLSDLTENTDWFYEYNATDFVTGTGNGWIGGKTAVGDDGVELMFTPATANHDWLVVGYNRMDGGSATTNYLTRMNSTGTTTETQPLVSQENEDTVNDRWVQFAFRTYDNLAASLQTFGMQSSQDSGTSGSILDAAVLAIDLDKFQAHSNTWTEAAQNTGTGSTFPGVTMSTSEITTGQAGGVFIMTQAIHDTAASFSYQGTRQQFDSSGGVLGDAPGRQSTFVPMNQGWDPTDEIGWHIFSINNTNAAASYTLTSDSSSNGPEPIEDRGNVAFTMELASAGVTITVTDEIAVEDTVSYSTMNTVNVSDEIAVEDAVTSRTVFVSDEISIEDQGATAVLSASATVSDDIAVEDTVSFSTMNTVNVNDDIAVEDTVSFSTMNTVNVNDDIAVEDTVSFSTMNTVNVNDEIAVEDATPIISTMNTVNVSDDIAVEDTVSIIAPGQVTVSDDIAVEDTVSYSTMNTVNVNDEIAVEDATPIISTMNTVNVNDDIAVEDTVSIIAPGQVTVSDDIAVEDTVSYSTMNTVNVNDEIAVEDATPIISTMNTVNVSDDIAVEDTVSIIAPGQVTVSDDIAVEDFGNTDVITVSDAIAIMDSASQGGVSSPVRNAIAIYVNKNPFTFGVFSDSNRMTCDGSISGAVIFNTDDTNLNICNGVTWILPNGTAT